MQSTEALLGEGRRNGRETKGLAEVQRTKEQPWHQHAATYLALGMSMQDAAKLCDCSLNTLSALLATDWFSEKVALAMKANDSDIMALFKGASLGAFATLVEITMDKKAPATARIASAKEILERHLGKSKQYVEVSTPGQSDNPVAEAEALQAELARLRADKTLTVLPAQSA